MEFADKHKDILKDVSKILGWLANVSSVGKSDMEQLKAKFDDLKLQAEQKLPSKALGDWNLEEVESIFEIQPLSSENEEPGDEWDLRPILREEFQIPATFDEFYDFLSKYPYCGD
ncbi:uncharacterized protein N7518_010087 [Penicillium psychrosexuale]|uniref:uncharacterized protein n=1 Tax=Penicillium psychrosexuale TaxID=1002107 RepID=UPI0025450C56|nr:uncharacterized protein N7518_010087 [Penicillium psychrosexuale]KAJ5781604.1 hypothetical protein N7518_010087 [Penicillium psychrosexuale]